MIHNHNLINEELNAESINFVEKGGNFNGVGVVIDIDTDIVDHLIIDNIDVEDIDLSDEDSFCTTSEDGVTCNYYHIFEPRNYLLSSSHCIPNLPCIPGYEAACDSDSSPFEILDNDNEEYIGHPITHTIINSVELAVLPDNNNDNNNNITTQVLCSKRKRKGADENDKFNSSSEGRDNLSNGIKSKHKGTKRRRKNASDVSEKNQFVLNHLYKYIPHDKYPRASLLRAFNEKRISNFDSINSATAIDKEYAKWRIGEAAQRRNLRWMKRKKTSSSRCSRSNNSSSSIYVYNNYDSEDYDCY